MKRNWQVRRTWIEQPDGERRWDQAYRLLLEWTRAAVPPTEEPEHASGVLRARLDRSTATDADD
jgi:hypothetical protein